jgi:hypothetical protein
MLNSTVLEVTFGLVFCYAFVALVTSSVYEAIASLFKLRAGSLLDGIKALLNDPQFTGLAKDLYNHALINPQDSGKATTEGQLNFKPSYIDPAHFTIALIDSIQGGGPGTFEELGHKIDVLPDKQLRELLRGMYARAEGNLERFQKALSSWFDSAMERVSGGYKRNAQLFSFLIALLIAALLDIDSFHLFRSLWSHPALVAQLGVPATPTASQALESLKDLPIGWVTFSPPPASVYFGWLVTASSALFGAPFWFDLLQRLVNLRGTGPKPDEPKK